MFPSTVSYLSLCCHVRAVRAILRARIFARPPLSSLVVAQPACQPGRLPARHPRRERVAGRGHGSPTWDASSRHERWSWALVVSAGRRLESRARVAVVGRFSQATRQPTWQPTTKPKELADLAATPGKSPHSPRAVPNGNLHCPRSLLIFRRNEDTMCPRQSSRLPPLHPAGSAQDSPVQPSRAMLGSRRPGGTQPSV